MMHRNPNDLRRGDVPWVAITLLYLALTGSLSLAARRLESRLGASTVR